jgi:2,3-bisphosphoglycerate-independent phosphoglycerate mutase
MTKAAKRPVVLCILDGWGWREDAADNAVLQANTPNFDRLWATSPRCFLSACEEDVGLPMGQFGNSEVGHMNLGAGRVVFQDLPRIDKAITTGALAQNVELASFCAALKASGGTCHLMGLISPGGVHAHQDQIAALANYVSAAGVPVAIHVFTDGRDVPPKSAAEYVAHFEQQIAGLPNTRIVTVSGRYYAMDRDKRWDRVQKAYDAIAMGHGQQFSDAKSVIDASYAVEINDEFIVPAIVAPYQGMHDGDGVLMGNFRTDRAREILAALLEPGFDGFARARVSKVAAALGMVEYSGELNAYMKSLFTPINLTQLLGEVVADAGMTQLRAAETEKYPHVTFFFNGGREEPYAGEERILVQSPKVATYDLQPEMSAPELTDKVVAAIDSGAFDLAIVNFANPDMVGHTGILSAAVKAVEAVDTGMGRIVAAVQRAGGAILITADHGNCEVMRDPVTGEPHTAHTLNVVPAMLVGGPPSVTSLRNGRLADVSPTLLALLGVPQPAEMTGQSLLDNPKNAAA